VGSWMLESSFMQFGHRRVSFRVRFGIVGWWC
jgi:hypothetical protein